MADDWSDAQNDAIVADCFAMLGDDIAVRLTASLSCRL